MLNEFDDIAAHAALPAIPQTLFGVDRKAIGAATLRTRADTFDFATQLDATSRYLILDFHGAGFGDLVEGGGA